MADMPAVSYKLVILILLLHACSSYILLERSPTAANKEDSFLLEPYDEDLATFVEITTDEKAKKILGDEIKDISPSLVVTTGQPSDEIADGVDIASGPDASITAQDPAQAVLEQEFFSQQEYLALEQGHPLVGLADLAIHQQGASTAHIQPPTDSSTTDAHLSNQQAYLTQSHPLMDLADLAIHQQKVPVTQGHPLMALTELAIQTAHSSGNHPEGVAPLAHLIEQISQEDAAEMTQEKVFAMAHAMEDMLEEIIASAPADPVTAPEPAPLPEPEVAPEPVSVEAQPTKITQNSIAFDATTEPSAMDEALEEILLEIYAEPAVDVSMEEEEEEGVEDGEEEEEEVEEEEEGEEEVDMDMTHQVSLLRLPFSNIFQCPCI